MQAIRKNATKVSERAIRKIVGRAWPLVLVNLAYAGHGLADTWFSARLGTKELAAVGFGSVTFLAIAAFYRGTTGYSLILFSQAMGRGGGGEVGSEFGRALRMVAWLSLTALLLPILLGWFVRVAFPAEPPFLQGMVLNYLQIRCFELPFAMFNIIVASFLIARNDSRTPMLLAWFAVLLNIALDWLFVSGNTNILLQSPSGIATATVLTNIVCSIFSLMLMQHRSRREMLDATVRHVPAADVMNALKSGCPLGVTEFAELASFCVFVSLIAQLGTEALAVNQIAVQYIAVTYAVSFAIATAVSSLIAEMAGRQEYKETEELFHQGILLAALCSSAFAAVCLTFPNRLIGLIDPDLEILLAGQRILMLAMAYSTVESIALVSGCALNGVGETFFTMATRLLLVWGLMLPIAAYMTLIGDNSDLSNVWLIAVTYAAITAVVFIVRWTRRKAVRS